MRAKFISAALAFLATLGCTAQTKVDNKPMHDLDLEWFLGDWYEIARYDHTFERGMDNVSTFYELRPDGKIRILNSGWKNGKASSKEAVAKVPDKNEPGLLRVSFFLPFYSDYRILMVDRNYHYALVGGGSNKYLWILSREPWLSEEDTEAILREATIRGYDAHKLLWVNQEINLVNQKAFRY